MDVNELLNDLQHGHSKFQINNFIINMSGLTDYGKYKQCLRELYNRYSNSEVLKYKIKLKKLKKIIFFMNKNIDLEIKNLEINLKSNNREIQEFYERAMILKNKLGDLTDKKINEHEKILWIQNIKKNMALDLMASGRVSKGILEIIMACENDIKDYLLYYVKNPNKVITWLENNNINNDNYVDYHQSKLIE